MCIASKEETINSSYRKIEAMYRRDCSTEEIVRATRLTYIDVLDVIQRIFAIDMIKKGFR